MDGSRWRRGFRRHEEHAGEGGSGTPQGEMPTYIKLDARELSGVFAAPQWLRDLGLLSWLFLGVALLGTMLISFVAITQVIFIPVVVAALIASVASPLMRWLQSHHVPRPAGAALVMLLIVVIMITTVVMVLGGIASQTAGIGEYLNNAASKISGWLQDAGVSASQADASQQDVSKAVSSAFETFKNGLVFTIDALSSTAIFLAFMILSLFFLLKDGPTIRRWGEAHLGVPPDVARVISSRTIGSLRGYFLGVTIVAAYNAVLIGLGALVIGVPLAGTIAVVTFVASYVPYLGAWAAGAFAVLIALSSQGTEAAIAMAIVALLANGILQQLIQPFAMGAALGIHPLAVLIVTIAGGAIFGTMGLVLAAPITSAITRISADLAAAKAEAAEGAEPGGGAPGQDPGGGGAHGPGDEMMTGLSPS